MNPIAGFAEIQDGHHARGEETTFCFFTVLVHVTDQILLILSCHPPETGSRATMRCARTCQRISALLVFIEDSRVLNWIYNRVSSGRILLLLLVLFCLVCNCNSH